MKSRGDISRRQFLRATGGAATAVTLAGCGGETGQETGALTGTRTGQEQGTEIRKDGPVYRRLNHSVTTLDPIAVTDEASSFVTTQVFDGLTGFPDGHPTARGRLAEGYESNDRGTVWRFTLREGATFHDGSAVTAHDFVYSLERLAASTHSRRSSFLLHTLGVDHETRTVTRDGQERTVYEPGSLAVTAEDDRTLRIELREPFVATLEMLAFTAFAAVPEGIVGDVDGYEGDLEYERFATEAPVGAGPFEFVDWQQGTEVKVQRYDDYYGRVPSIAGVHWQIVDDAETRYEHAMNRNVDTFSIPTSRYDPEKVTVEERTDRGVEVGTYGPARNGETLRYSRRAQLYTFLSGFNMAAVPKPARLAFAHAIDQRSLVENVFKGRGRAAPHLTPPGLFPRGADFYAEHAASYPYAIDESRIQQAKAVMEDAGYGPDDQVEVTWTHPPNATLRSMGKIIRDQVSPAYVDVTLESAGLSAMVKRGRQGNLDAFALGWGADYPAMQNFLQLLNPPQTITGEGRTPISFLNWTDERGSMAGEAARAWQRIVGNSGPSERAQRARDDAAVTMEEANWEDVGVLTLIHPFGEQFSYEWVDLEPFGAMGPSNQQYDGVRIGDRP
ncbi:MAG: ABC transporter substrate-binding protein [Haloferacaceae archaeon]